MKWEKLLSRRGVDLPTISAIDIIFFKLIWGFAGKKEELFFSYLKDRHLTHYIAVNQQKLGLSIFKQHFNSPEKVKDYYTEGKRFQKEFEESSEEFKKKLRKNKSSLLDASMLDAFIKFREHLMKICDVYSISSWLAIEMWQGELNKIVSKLIEKNYLESKRDKILACLYNPWKKTAIVEIQEKLKNLNMSGKKDMQKIVEDYQFLRSWVVIWYNQIDESWVKGLGKADIDKEGYSMEEVLELLNPYDKEKHFLLLAPYIIFFKDWRDDFRRRFVYCWNFLFQCISEKFGVVYDDLGYLTLDEIEDLLRKKRFDKKIIEQRKKYGCVITSDGSKLKIKLHDKKIPEKYLNIINRIEHEIKNSEIKGIIVQSGKVKGQVIVMASYHDLKKVFEGSILVANTTHPNYLPAMQKAAAFVTDEGGMISHAAIIAREMKKPCIVGTKIATKALKDGDMVEVDADRGIVRKIK